MISRTEQYLRTVERFFSEAGFPAFMLAALAAWQIVLAALVFAPGDMGRWGGLAQDFRVWCFGYDPGTGAMEWAGAWIMLSQPAILGMVFLFVWWSPLKDAVKHGWATLVSGACSGVAAAGLAVAALYFGFAPPAAAGTVIFSGQGLRTAIEPPSFILRNQEGDMLGLDDLRGGVVLLTAIYSTCGVTCPMLIVQAMETIERLPEGRRDEVTFVAVSLDPENDTMEQTAHMARAYGLEAPRFHFLSGDPDEVNRVLDRLNVARQYNEATGMIDHANLYFVIDRNGRIAYRFNLSERHEAWLGEALTALVDEG